MDANNSLEGMHMLNEYTINNISSIDGSPVPRLPFTVKWEADWNSSDGRDLIVKTVGQGEWDSYEWKIAIHVDESPSSPRDNDGNLTRIYAYTAGYGRHDVILDELDDADEPFSRAAEALRELIGIHGANNFDEVERRFKKWAGYTGSTYKIIDHSSQGYSQSDWSRWIVLVDSNVAEDWVRAELDQYDDYLIGDVYGYTVEDTGDSCWGFYGENWQTNGAMDYIAAELRAHILYVEECRAEREAALAKAKRSVDEMIVRLNNYKKVA